MEGVSRRHLLRCLGIGGLSAVAGCGQGQSDPSPTETSPSSSPAGSPTQTPTDTQSTTAEDNTAPELTNYNATPQQNAEQLMVRLQGQDDQEIGRARIWYGESTLEEAVEGKTVELQGTLDDVLQQDPAEYGIVHFLLEDAAGNVVEETYRPDEERPSVDTFSTYMREDAGEFGVTLDAADETALRTLELVVGDQTYTVDVLGEETGSIDEVVTTDHPDLGDAITPFQKNKLTALLQDWAGNETGRVESPYVRKYDTMDDTRLDIGAVYLPFACDGLDRCVPDKIAEPEVGDYGNPEAIRSEVTSRHIDQMTAHGIGRVLYNFPGSQRMNSTKRIQEFLESDLLNQVAVEPYYGAAAFWESRGKSLKDEILPRDLSILRDNFLIRDNAATFKGRPVFSTWNILFLYSDDEFRDKVREEYGGYEELVEDMRSQLRVDGTDPFLVAGVGNVGSYLLNNEEVEGFVSQFDGVGSWFPGDKLEQGKTTKWSEASEAVEEDYKETTRFTDKHGLEFFPSAFPGFRDEASKCTNRNGRHIPRNETVLSDTLELAEEFGTADRLFIATWNAWVEGHQIEPGTFHGNDYGEEYVEVVQNFQQ